MENRCHQRRRRRPWARASVCRPRLPTGGREKRGRSTRDESMTQQHWNGILPDDENGDGCWWPGQGSLVSAILLNWTGGRENKLESNLHTRYCGISGELWWRGRWKTTLIELIKWRLYKYMFHNIWVARSTWSEAKLWSYLIYDTWPTLELLNVAISAGKLVVCHDEQIFVQRSHKPASVVTFPGLTFWNEQNWIITYIWFRMTGLQ